MLIAEGTRKWRKNTCFEKENEDEKDKGEVSFGLQSWE